MSQRNTGSWGEVATGCISHSPGDGHDPADGACDSPRLSSRGDSVLQPVDPQHAPSGDDTVPAWRSYRRQRDQAIVALARSRFSFGNDWSAWMDVLRLRRALAHPHPGLQLRLLLFRIWNSYPVGHLLQG